MNLKECNGRVPILTGDVDRPFLLIDFPTREKFDLIFKNSSAEHKDKYWEIIQGRSNGHALAFLAKSYSLSRERIRQIEAKFIRRMRLDYQRSFLNSAKL